MKYEHNIATSTLKTKKRRIKMKYKIFILDDRKENLEAAVAALSEYAEEIQTAMCYEEGARVLENFTPDIAFIDMNFPRKNGEADEKIGYEFRKECLRTRNIPSAIVTGGTNHGTPVVTIKAGYYFPLEKINPCAYECFNLQKEVYTDKIDIKTWIHAYNHMVTLLNQSLKGGFEFYVQILRKLRSEM